MEESYPGSASYGVLHLSWWQRAEVALDIPTTHMHTWGKERGTRARVLAKEQIFLFCCLHHPGTVPTDGTKTTNDKVPPFKAARVPRMNSCPKTEQRRGSAPGTVTQFLWHQTLPVRFVSWSLGPLPLGEPAAMCSGDFCSSLLGCGSTSDPVGNP